jgi:hypothetical protein
LRRSEAKYVDNFLDENSGTIATKCSNEIWTDRLNSTIQQSLDKKGDEKDCEIYNLTAKKYKKIGVNYKSLFSSSLMLRTSKLECLALSICDIGVKQKISSIYETKQDKIL